MLSAFQVSGWHICFNLSQAQSQCLEHNVALPELPSCSGRWPKSGLKVQIKSSFWINTHDATGSGLVYFKLLRQARQPVKVYAKPTSTVGKIWSQTIKKNGFSVPPLKYLTNKLLKLLTSRVFLLTMLTWLAIKSQKCQIAYYFKKRQLKIFHL